LIAQPVVNSLKREPPKSLFGSPVTRKNPQELRRPRFSFSVSIAKQQDKYSLSRLRRANPHLDLENTYRRAAMCFASDVGLAPPPSSVNVDFEKKSPPCSFRAPHSIQILFNSLKYNNKIILPFAAPSLSPRLERLIHSGFGNPFYRKRAFFPACRGFASRSCGSPHEPGSIPFAGRGAWVRYLRC